MGLGPGNWELIVQPVRIYGDKQPHQQTLEPGVVAQCYVKVRAAMCFPNDALSQIAAEARPHLRDE
jgi:hypothetical protein